MAIVTIFYIYCVIYKEFLEFIRIRQDFLFTIHRDSSDFANTVLVTDISNDILSVDKLYQIFRNLPREVRRICINRDYRNLIKQAKKHENLIKMLESAEITWLKKLIVKKSTKLNIDQDDEFKNERL